MSSEHLAPVEVAGRRMTITQATFEARCENLIEDEQRKLLPDNALIGVLCEAVRLSREYCDAMKRSI